MVGQLVLPSVAAGDDLGFFLPEPIAATAPEPEESLQPVVTPGARILEPGSVPDPELILAEEEQRLTAEALDEANTARGELDLFLGLPQSESDVPPLPLEALVESVDYAPDAGTQAVDSATISGVVTDEATSMPLAGVDVYACSYEYCIQTVTDGSGAYSIAGLPAGTAWLSFYDHVASHISSYAEVLFDGVSSVVVNASLVQGGSIAGVLTDSRTGLPITEACAVVYDSAEGYYQGVEGCTDENGRYQTTGLAAGNYRVQFYGQTRAYLPEWWDDVVASVDATAVTVAVGLVTEGISAALDPGSTISGSVTYASDGIAVSDFQVVARHAESGAWGGSAYIYDGDGTYTVAGLAAGEYELQITGSTFLDATRLVTVPATTDVTGVDVVVDPGGSISGKITDADTGEAVDGACVWASGPTSRYVCADAGGHYTVRGLVFGQYSLESSASTYIRTTRPVEITEQQPDVVLDLALTVGARIVGAVQDELGAPVMATLQAYAAESGAFIISGSADESGSFTLEGLPTGAVKLRARTSDNVHLDTWYPSAWSSADAEPIAVVAGQTAGPLTVVTAIGGAITGTVRVPEGVNTADVVITASSDNHWRSAWMQESGEYRLGPLPAGEYRVQFSDYAGALVPEYFDDSETWSDARPITVALGADTGGIDAALEVAGSISGTITGPEGEPVEGWIDVYRQDASYAHGYWFAGGLFEVNGLRAGDYRLQFGSEQFVSEWYDDADSYETATPVTLTSGEHVAGLEVSLAAASGIEGTVTDDVTGDSLGACVYAYTSTTVERWEYAGYDCASGGNYFISGLTEGTSYYLWASPSDDTHVSEWFEDASSAADAKSVAVTDGRVIADFRLSHETRISGQVTDAETGEPLVGVYVRASNLGGEWWDEGGSDSSDESGRYAINLAPGDYRISAWESGYFLEYWQDTRDSWAADVLTVEQGVDQDAIDFVLTPNPEISWRRG